MMRFEQLFHLSCSIPTSSNGSEPGFVLEIVQQEPGPGFNESRSTGGLFKGNE